MSTASRWPEYRKHSCVKRRVEFAGRIGKLYTLLPATFKDEKYIFHGICSTKKLPEEFGKLTIKYRGLGFPSTRCFYFTQSKLESALVIHRYKSTHFVKRISGFLSCEDMTIAADDQWNTLESEFFSFWNLVINKWG